MKYYVFSANSPLHFVNIGNFSGGHEFIHDCRIISDYEVFVVQSGKLYIEQGEKYVVTPKQMLFNLPHVLQKGYKENYVTFYWFHFTYNGQPLILDEPELLSKLGEADFCDRNIIVPQQFDLKYYEKIIIMLGQLFNSAKSKRRQTANDYTVTSIMLEISNQIVERLKPTDLSADTKLSSILAYIEDNKHLPLTVKAVAEQFEYNEKYFSRFFKAKMHVSPKQFITDKKMNLAKSILVSTSHSVGDVARFVGYEDEHLFMRIFKSETGMTPSHYRNLFTEKG